MSKAALVTSVLGVTQEAEKFGLYNSYPGLVELFTTNTQETKNISATWDNLWYDAFNVNGLGQGVGDEVLFGAICYVGFVFATGSLLFFAISQFKLWHEGNYQEYFLNLVWPLAIAILLGNNGQLLANFSFQIRGFINQTNQDVLERVASGVSLQEAFNNLQKTVGGRIAIADYIQQCENLSGDDQSSCLESVRVQVEEERKKIEEQKGNKTLAKIVNTFFSDINDLFLIISSPAGYGVKKTLELIMPSWESVIFSVLAGMMRAYQYFVEIGLFLTTLVGPLAVGGSLLPVENKPFFAWLIGLFSIGCSKITFNMVAGLAAVAAAENYSVGDDQVPIYIIFALFAPVLASGLALFGGMATWHSLTSATESAVGFTGKLLNTVT
jgi:hypothetical protein